MGNKGNLKKKTLIFLPGPEDAPFPDIGNLLDFLQLLGFSAIYFNKEKKACSLYQHDNIYANDELEKARTPTAEMIARQLVIPVEECLFIPKEALKSLVSMQFTNAEFLAPYDNIVLIEDYISQTVIHEILQVHANKIQKLQCDQTNLVKLDQFYSSPSAMDERNGNKLFNLRIFSAAETDFNLISSLLAQSESLEELNIAFCKNLNENLKGISFSRLKKLDLSHTDINCHSLMIILSQAPYLEELDLSSCNLKGELTSLNLPCLKKLKVHGISISPQSLRNLLSHTRTLEYLSMECYQNINQDFTAVNLSQLKTLDISSNTFIGSLLPTLLAQTPCLEELILSVTSTKQSHLSFEPLPFLKRLYIVESDIEVVFLQSLLVQTKNLELLNVSLCSGLEGDLHDIDLPHLKILNISDTSLSTRALQTLLGKTNNLTQLKATDCDNLTYTLEGSFPQLRSLNLQRSVLNQDSLQNLLVHASHLEKLSLDDLDLDLASLSQGPLPPKVKNLLEEVMKSQLEKKSAHRVPPQNSSTIQGSNFHRQQPRIAIDADTSAIKRTYHYKRQFIGSPFTPHPSSLRLHAYNGLEIDSQNTRTPFLLNAVTTMSLQVQPIQRSLSPLKERFDAFAREDKACYLGIFDIEVSNQWVPIPSVYSEEQLIGFFAESNLNLQFSKNAWDGFYYVAASDLASPQAISLQILLEAPLKEKSIRELPLEIQELIKECRGYRSDSLRKNSYSKGIDYLNAIIHYRVGACRHRAIAFKYLMNEKFPQVPVNLIKNTSHIYAEVFYEGNWIRCDLGGYEAHEKIDEALFADSDLNTKTPQLLAEELVSLELSPRGNVKPHEFFERAIQVDRLTLHESLSIPAQFLKNLGSIETLTIISASVSVKELHDLFHRLPNLKTLTILQAFMSPEEFASIDLGILSRLEWVKLEGEFISGNEELTQVIQRHPHHQSIRWIAESPNLVSEMSCANLLPDVEISAPKRRALRAISNQTPSDIEAIMDSKKSTLITTSCPNDYAYFLQTQCLNKQIPIFYVTEPSQLKCRRPFIEKQDNGYGIMRKGPGGPFYEFIKTHPEGLVLIDYSRFSAADIVQFNSLYNPTPKIEDLDFPCSVLALINPEVPDAYDGADFYSRFGQIFYNLKPDTSAPSLTSHFVNELKPDDLCIELAGLQHFTVHLKGTWTFEGKQLVFQPPTFKEKLGAHTKRLVLKNSPLYDAEFLRFVQDFELEHPEGPALVFYQGIDWSDANTTISISNTERLPEHFQLLNTATISSFLGRYMVCDETFILKPGIIQSTAAPFIEVYLTESLSEHQWYALIQSARVHDKHIHFHLGPDVVLPEFLAGTRAKSKYIEPRAHTIYCINLPESLDKDFIVIDVSELSVADLCESIQIAFDEETLGFRSQKTAGFLRESLNRSMRIVLKGSWSQELRAAMQGLIIQRMQEENPLGQLVIVGNEEKEFPCLLPSDYYKPKPRCSNRSQPVEFENRYAAVEKSLQNNPFVFLQGATAVGKTYFIQKQWRKKHQVFYGEQALGEWLGAKPLEEEEEDLSYICLFIDEANITSSNWSIFEGLFNNPPAIFYQGQYHYLSSRHRVIFSGNPNSYGGARTQPRLFNNPHPILEFLPLPLTELALPEAVKYNLLSFADRVKQHYPQDLILTPREYLMIGQLAEMLMKEGHSLTVQALIEHIGFEYLKSHIPQEDWPHFRPEKSTLAFDIPNLKEFFVTESNLPALQALSWQLKLRHQRLTNPSFQPGIGGVVLEGPPGIGKSELVIKALEAKGLKESQDFIFIPVSLDLEEKEAALREAFHQGKIAIIDEINSSPMIERLLNALLEGHDLDDKPPQNPGFLLIGTQNPLSFKGRKKTTLPLKHRLQHVYSHDYSLADMVKILMHYYSMPRKVAIDLAQTLKSKQQNDKRLCFRDLLKWADNWQKLQPKEYIEFNLAPLSQIGSTCKITSLANVDNFFSSIYSFQPLPLHKLKTHLFSLRQQAKNLGSKQGELLAFDSWEELAKQLGYTTHSITLHSQDYYGFLNSITGELKQGNFPLIAFAVDQKTGHPDPNPAYPEQVEHSAVIVGYDPKQDQIALAHWGRIYHVDALTLFESNLKLTDFRHAEHYKKNRDYQSPFLNAKYLPMTSVTKNVFSTATPHLPGFKGRILVLEKPNESFLMQRERLWESLTQSRKGKELVHRKLSKKRSRETPEPDAKLPSFFQRAEKKPRVLPNSPKQSAAEVLGLTNPRIQSDNSCEDRAVPEPMEELNPLNTLLLNFSQSYLY